MSPIELSSEELVELSIGLALHGAELWRLADRLRPINPTAAEALEARAGRVVDLSDRLERVWLEGEQ